MIGQRWYNVETFLGAGPVADYVAQAIDLLDVAPVDVNQHGLKSLQVAMDMRDNWERFLLHPPAVSPVWRAGRSGAAQLVPFTGGRAAGRADPTGERIGMLRRGVCGVNDGMAGPRKHSDLRQRGDSSVC